MSAHRFTEVRGARLLHHESRFYISHVRSSRPWWKTFDTIAEARTAGEKMAKHYRAPVEILEEDGKLIEEIAYKEEGAR